MPEAIKMRERAGRYCPDSCAEALNRALKSCKSGKAWRHTTHLPQQGGATWRVSFVLLGRLAAPGKVFG